MITVQKTAPFRASSLVTRVRAYFLSSPYLWLLCGLAIFVAAFLTVRFSTERNSLDDSGSFVAASTKGEFLPSGHEGPVILTSEHSAQDTRLSQREYYTLMASASDVVVKGRIVAVNYNTDDDACFHSIYTVDIVKVLSYSKQYRTNGFNTTRVYILRESGPLSDGGRIKDVGVPVLHVGDEKYLFLCNFTLQSFVKAKNTCIEQVRDVDFSLLGVSNVDNITLENDLLGDFSSQK